MSGNAQLSNLSQITNQIGNFALFFKFIPLSSPPGPQLPHALSLFVADILKVLRGPRAPTLF